MDYFLGDVVLFPYTFAPMDWADCAGQLIPIAQNQALFAIIGTKYGGDGRTNFALPDLRGAEPIPNTRYCIAIAGCFPVRS